MIYSIALYLYALAVVLVSPFRKKAWLMVKGQWNTFRILRKSIRREEMYVWFHAASLGEFEQGRPLMERLRRAQGLRGGGRGVLSPVRHTGQCAQLFAVGSSAYGVLHQI